jgi:diaminopimelate decarboxylase
MDHFYYQQGRLMVESLPLEAIAERYGTPCYVYSRATIEHHWRVFSEALAGRPHLICYAVKANSNIALLSLLARLGAGFDIVSVGELERVVHAGGDPARVVFSGVGKRHDEIERALELGIRCFNVESEPELARIEAVAACAGTVAPVALRVNPDVDAGTHPYISTGLKQNKFGIPIGDAQRVFRQAHDSPSLAVTGIDCHIGSQLTSVAPYVDALERVVALYDELLRDGIEVDHIDVGGGLGVRYRDENPPSPAEWVDALLPVLGEREVELLVEPGRSIVANAGLLLTRVEYLKQGEERRFAIVDAAMNDLLRPALYDAWQRIDPLLERAGDSQRYDVVGPVCESGDFLGRDRELVIEPGDLLAVRSAGAYGAAMGSTYNSRPLPPEVLVDGECHHLVRSRQPLESLYQFESIPEWQEG